MRYAPFLTGVPASGRFFAIFLPLRALLELAVSYPKGAIKETVADPKISFEWTNLCGERSRCPEARRQRHNSGPGRYTFAL